MSFVYQNCSKLKLFPSVNRIIISACTVQELTVSSLWTACPCERELNLSHLAARCTTASPGPLRKDLSVLHESTPQHQTRDRTRRTLSASWRLKGSNSWRFCPVPSRRVLWAKGVSYRLGVGEGIEEGNSSFWMWCQVLTILWTMAENKQQRKRSGITDRSIPHM